MVVSLSLLSPSPSLPPPSLSLPPNLCYFLRSCDWFRHLLEGLHSHLYGGHDTIPHLVRVGSLRYQLKTILSY